jgi:hypothetical protein
MLSLLDTVWSPLACEVDLRKGYAVGWFSLESAAAGGFYLLALRPTALDAVLDVNRVPHA